MRRAALAVSLALVATACAEDRVAPPPSGNGVHAPGIADRASSAWHGALLRRERWGPMIDATRDDACGRCHEGAPARPEGVTHAAPGATACTTCHTEAQGVLACATCHGPGAIEDVARAGAHAAHTDASAIRASAITCATCHPAPGDGVTGDGVIGGLHANGQVEVIFDEARVGPEASYDRASGTCAVSCHDHGGARSRPRWSEGGPMRCGDCHASPPAAHFTGPCTTCHHDADATGSALTSAELHMNGRVDLGDGSGKCGACHGRGDDPWPRTNAHPSHEAPALTTPIDCASCHPAHASIAAAGHMDGVVQIAFAGRAIDRDAIPAWDGASCSEVACHGARLNDAPAVIPKWTGGADARACGACHGIPPTQHTQSTSCGRATCHGDEIARDATGAPSIAPSGTSRHVNGVIDVALP